MTAILLTNIDGVSIGNVHTHSRALLLWDNQARGFLYNRVTPSFNVWLASLEYTIEPLEVNGLPLRAADLRLATRDAEGVTLRLMLCTDNDDPVNVTTFETASPEQIWEVLDRRIVAYWQAPYFLESRQVSIHDARRTVGIMPVR